MDDNVARRIDVAPGPGTHFSRIGEDSLLESIKLAVPFWFEALGAFHELRLAPGEYYPRMARLGPYPEPILDFNPTFFGESSYIAVARSQLVALNAQLQRICQTVHPHASTMNVFGHDIRNLLILACTEVEAHWRGILVANGSKKSRFDTRDYIALQDAMRLGSYAILFPNFPWLDAFQPFDGWTSSANLPWYQAYNAVKHNREGEFEEGSLRHAFQAVSGCAIMLCAQFGPEVFVRSELQNTFAIASSPLWTPTECYMPPFDNAEFRRVSFPFST
jgi:hypothetical protein